jgi:hypothetical protein
MKPEVRSSLNSVAAGRHLGVLPVVKSAISECNE